jgi:curved DNA-binding protein CbpA
LCFKIRTLSNRAVVDQASRPKHSAGLSLAPYRSLGVMPFWFADEAALEALRNQFTKLTRSLHPDRFASQGEAAMKAAESKSAEVNAAYALLKDPTSMADFIVRSQSGQNLSKSSMPPMLAADYFELQEHPDNTQLSNRFRDQLLAWVAQSDSQFVLIMARHPFLGVGDAVTAPWTDSDVNDLRKAREAQRFAHSMLQDFRQKFKDSHAHSD